MKKVGQAVDLYGREIDVLKNQSNNVWCDHAVLTEIKFEPYQVIDGLYCQVNLLTRLRVPQGVKTVICDVNQLEFLYLPDDIQQVYCDRNRLKDLDVPDSVIVLECDADLFEYDKCNVDTVNIFYKER